MMDTQPFGLNLASIQTTIPGPRSLELAARLQKVETPGVTHVSHDFPIFWEKALGSNIQDVDGNIYVDLTAAFGVANLGHSPPIGISALHEQALKLSHGMGDVHPPAIKIELLELLTSLFPEKNAQALLSTSGADAVETALKSAFLATDRPGILCFDGAYHGLSYGTLNVSGQNKFRDPFLKQLSSFTVQAKFPKAHDSIDQSFSDIERLMKESEKTSFPIGAILVEPIQGRAGVIVPPKGWLFGLRKLTERHQILLIVDEIMTGFGRTGARFAINHENVCPDLLCVGKALTGMLPFSACLGRKEVMKTWPTLAGEALHTSTFLGHPLGCAVALTVIKEIERLNLADRAQKMGIHLFEKMQRWNETMPIIQEIRGKGLMIGVELQKSNQTGLAFEVAKKALKKGLILLPSGGDGNVVSITPPLTISECQLDWALSTLKEVLLSVS